MTIYCLWASSFLFSSLFFLFFSFPLQSSVLFSFFPPFFSSFRFFYVLFSFLLSPISFTQYTTIFMQNPNIAITHAQNFPVLTFSKFSAPTFALDLSFLICSYCIRFFALHSIDLLIIYHTVVNRLVMRISTTVLSA